MNDTITPENVKQITLGKNALGTVLCSAMEQSVKQYSRETGDARIHALPLPGQSPEDGLVTGNHLTERTHEKVPEMLVEALRPILDATGSGNASL